MRIRRAATVALSFERKKDMVRLFISQPMKGKTDEEILAVREKAIASAKAKIADGEEVEVIDSFFQNAPADARPLWFLGKSLELLSTADVAYFAKGWEDARGCRIENTCAIEYDIDVIEDYTEDWLPQHGSKDVGRQPVGALQALRGPHDLGLAVDQQRQAAGNRGAGGF